MNYDDIQYSLENEWTDAEEDWNYWIPPGWRHFHEEMARLTRLIPSAIIRKISIDKGLLRYTTTAEFDIDQRIVNRYAQSLAYKTSLVCMVCSKHGIRRKGESLQPCLCETHYIEYANFLDRKNQNVEGN